MDPHQVASIIREEAEKSADLLERMAEGAYHSSDLREYCKNALLMLVKTYADLLAAQ